MNARSASRKYFTRQKYMRKANAEIFSSTLDTARKLVGTINEID